MSRSKIKRKAIELSKKILREEEEEQKRKKAIRKVMKEKPSKKKIRLNNEMLENL